MVMGPRNPKVVEDRYISKTVGCMEAVWSLGRAHQGMMVLVGITNSRRNDYSIYVMMNVRYMFNEYDPVYHLISHTLRAHHLSKCPLMSDWNAV